KGAISHGAGGKMGTLAQHHGARLGTTSADDDFLIVVLNVLKGMFMTTGEDKNAILFCFGQKSRTEPFIGWIGDILPRPKKRPENGGHTANDGKWDIETEIDLC